MALPDYVLISSFIVVGIDGWFRSPAAIVAAECCSCVNDIHSPTGALLPTTLVGWYLGMTRI